MQLTRLATLATLATLAPLTMSLALAALVGCDKKPESTAPAKPAAAPANHDDHGHGAVTQLGEQSVGGFTIKASRDGDITPGSDAPIDVWVTGGAAKVAAVRFWIGTQDAKGSVKAKAELEKDNWHTHAEIPKPLPPGSKLWVEVETDKAEKHTASFDLKV